jgi:hypothetical protein
MLWDIVQQAQINRSAGNAVQAENAARLARSEMRGATDDIRELEKRFDALSLTCAALWELLRQETRMSDEQLVDKIQEIDLQDGSLDGKVAHDAKQCPKCPQKNHPHRDTCLYCGATLGPNRLFP